MRIGFGSYKPNAYNFCGVFGDVVRNRRQTGCEGIMSVEAVLGDPAIFASLATPNGDGSASRVTGTKRKHSPQPAVVLTASEKRRAHTRRRQLRIARLAHEYFDLFDLFPAPSFAYATSHLRYLLGRDKKDGRYKAVGSYTQEQLRSSLDSATSVADLRVIVDKAFEIGHGELSHGAGTETTRTQRAALQSNTSNVSSSHQCW